MNQHRSVELAEVRLTRLPVGRAEGRAWLTFIARGTPDQPVRPDWHIDDHVFISWADLGPADILETDESRTAEIASFRIVIRDVADSSLLITYTDDGHHVDHEVVDIPT